MAIARGWGIANLKLADTFQQRRAFRTLPWLCQELARAEVSASDVASVDAQVADTLKVAALVQRFRSRGHLVAQLDPLKRVDYGPWLGDIGIASPWCDKQLLSLLRGFKPEHSPAQKAAFAARELGLHGPADPDRQFHFGGALFAGNPANIEHWTLPEVIERMQASYCSTITAEFDHLQSQEQQEWVAQRMEQPFELSTDDKQQVLQDILVSDAFEGFLASKFPNNKRFGIEGCEALLAGLRAMVRRCAAQGVERMEVGMPHRGRLNLLCNLLHKPAGLLFGEMVQAISEFHVGDVQYHQGESSTLTFAGKGGAEDAKIRVSIAPNPSHLEAVNAVVQGMVRAEQDQLGDSARRRVIGLLLHGDAAFCGLGMVAEGLQMANVPGYTTGGTLHVVINNQLGFTTLPRDGRSSPHPTDMAKAIGAPVLHANADDPEAVVRACAAAADWRAAFGRDVVVDLVCYRRHGHNELDEPDVTLPYTYGRIEAHPTALELYAAGLEAAGTASTARIKSLRDRVEQNFADQYAKFEQGKYRMSTQDFISSSWQGDALQAVVALEQSKPPIQEPTGLPMATLQWVGGALCTVPDSFNVHPHVATVLENRRKMVEMESSRVNFAMAEALAFGSLALHREFRPPNATKQDYEPWEGLNVGAYSVRMSGQDAERGTFNQRHHSIVDQKTSERLVLLESIAQAGGQEKVEIFNSPLNEAAVLGFEYGYSLGSIGRTLTIWEAQFGDFCNNAQVMIDQFVAAAEERWNQRTGLVLMLPHGLEGQGPDHSSARIERFLQLCNDDPDHLPGHSPAHRRQIASTFDSLARESGGYLRKEQTLELLSSIGISGSERGEAADILWQEMGLADDANISKEVWDRHMVQFVRRDAERHANMFVVNATTPAQLFHALRRQMNRPFQKPLVLLTPKFLLHHRPATSALSDFVIGTHFNRVIDDGKASDNTRHLARHPKTGEPYLVPPDEMRRVVLCSGPIFYHLSNARRARKIRDIALVRLEQIAPFPHDLLVKAIRQYQRDQEYAEVVWCQEEPKNQGAWRYVKTRLECAMRELLPPCHSTPKLQYIGRQVAAAPATASVAIHRNELKEIVDAALTLP